MGSRYCSSALLLTTAVLLFSIVSQASAQNPGQLAHDLSFSLSVVFVAIAVIIMTIIAVVLLRRAKQGYFCCLKPRIRYPPVKRTTRSVRLRDPEAANTPTPSYEVHPRGVDIAPPDYQDALHDTVINTGESNDQGEMRTDDVDEDCDDRTPLNP